MDEMRLNTVFPVFYDVEQSKIDDRTKSYTIVFDKNEENLRENEEKVQRWTNILSEVQISSGSRSLKSGIRAPPTQQQIHQLQLHQKQQRIQLLQLFERQQGWLQLLEERQRIQKHELAQLLSEKQLFEKLLSEQQLLEKLLSEQQLLEQQLHEF
eukprot:XP_024444102.1 uncharacterized protein LOC112324626 [Populus trichocarpa]